MGILCDTGITGEQGLKGDRGQKGDLGLTGPQGVKGSYGIKGNIGSVGLPGMKGNQGVRGPTGIQGHKGDAGAPGAAVGGVTYKRWGKSTCRSGATLVYAGRTGSSYYTKGGGANYICMPNDPQYTLTWRPGIQGLSHVYGTEYETPPPGYSVNQHDALCAVCYVAIKHTTVMIPAHTSCPTGWTREYHGYLVSENYFARTMFVCVDTAMESVPGSQADVRGGHFYFVEAHCSGLSCPPYYNERELGCVVCSK